MMKPNRRFARWLLAAALMFAGAAPAGALAADEGDLSAPGVNPPHGEPGHVHDESESQRTIPGRSGFDFTAWEAVPVQEGGLEKSLYTFAYEFVREVTGNPNYGGRHPIENLFSMAWESEPWLHQPILKVRYPDLKKVFAIKKHERVSIMQMEQLREQWLPLTEKSPEAKKEMNKLHLHAYMIFGAPGSEQPMPPLAEQLRLVPTVDFRGDKSTWRSVDDVAGRNKDIKPEEQKLVAAYGAAREAFLKNDAAAFNAASNDTVAALGALGVPMFQPEWKFRLDRWYTHASLYSLAGWIFFFSAALYLISYLAGAKAVKPLAIGATAVLGLGAAVNVAALVVRGVLAGRTPVANLFESAVFIIGGITIFALILTIYYRARITGLAGATLGAFFMGMADTMPTQYGRKILPLIDALQSYWLHIHVTSMLISYALFAVAFFVACAYVARSLLMRRRAGFDAENDSTLLYLDSMNFRIITIGMPILTAGVILGAVWAAEAWGRPWAFDPKETAAAITWMIYAFYLHARLFLGWRGSKGVWVSILGAGAVLFTYLGVSFFLPSLHSYASDGESSFLGFLKSLLP